MISMGRTLEKPGPKSSIHPSAWKWPSANFALKKFSKVRRGKPKVYAIYDVYVTLRTHRSVREGYGGEAESTHSPLSYRGLMGGRNEFLLA